MKLKFFFYFILSAVLIWSSCITQKKLPIQTDSEKNEPKQLIDTEYYAMVEKPAIFQGGNIQNFIVYLNKEIKYPPNALKQRKQGTVIVQFGVDWEGKTKVFSVLKSTGTVILDNEVLRAIENSPPWEPAINQEYKVGQLFVLQIKFDAKKRSIEIK